MDLSIFWPEFDAAGMLTEIECRHVSSGKEDPFKAMFNSPDTVVMDGMMHATDYCIEYQTRDVVLARGDQLIISGNEYHVRQTPKTESDGFFAIALLDKKS